ncbi:MAG: UvrD-helicase domain-containing protein, partial [Thermoplasmata archaeon]
MPDALPTPRALLSRLQEISKKKYTIEQEKAILHRDGPLWITAGPGSGKSEVLIARTLRLLISDHVAPESIVLTTFTEKAAANLENRIATYLDDLGYADVVDAADLYTGTLHSLCNSIMRDERYEDFVDFELLNENEQLFFLYNQNDILEYFQSDWEALQSVFPGYFSRRYGPNRWSRTAGAGFLFDRITEFRVDAEAMKHSQEEPAGSVAAFYGLYRERLKGRYRVDYATLQEYFLRFLTSPQGESFLEGDPDRNRPPIRYVLVDEFQDANPIQEDIYFGMTQQAPHNLAVVGDDDQALYRFRGGTVDSLVRFGERCQRTWGKGPVQVNLRDNFRSHPTIVEWFDRYMSQAPIMQKSGVRAPGKAPMVAHSKVKGEYPAVSLILGGSLREAAEKLTDFLEALNLGEHISDWRDIGILLSSTRETPRFAGPFADALRDRGIPFYNPRNRSLHQDPRIQELFGALVATLDRGFETFKAVRGGVRREIRTWIDAFETLSQSDEGGSLKKYVDSSATEIDKLPSKHWLNVTVMDVLYRILAHPPFQSLKEDPNYATRFALVTDLIDAYTAFTERYGLLRTSSVAGGRMSFSFLMNFFYQFSGFIEAYGLNEPEDPEQLLPLGYVQIMTVHQAKGLEFPVVVVGSLNDRPRPGGDHWTEDFLAPWSPRQPVGSEE